MACAGPAAMNGTRGQQAGTPQRKAPQPRHAVFAAASIERGRRREKYGRRPHGAGKAAEKAGVRERGTDRRGGYPSQPAAGCEEYCCAPAAGITREPPTWRRHGSHFPVTRSRCRLWREYREAVKVLPAGVCAGLSAPVALHLIVMDTIPQGRLRQVLIQKKLKNRGDAAPGARPAAREATAPVPDPPGSDPNRRRPFQSRRL